MAPPTAHRRSAATRLRVLASGAVLGLVVGAAGCSNDDAASSKRSTTTAASSTETTAAPSTETTATGDTTTTAAGEDGGSTTSLPEGAIDSTTLCDRMVAADIDEITGVVWTAAAADPAPTGAGSCSWMAEGGSQTLAVTAIPDVEAAGSTVRSKADFTATYGSVTRSASEPFEMWALVERSEVVLVANEGERQVVVLLNAGGSEDELVDSAVELAQAAFDAM